MIVTDENGNQWRMTPLEETPTRNIEDDFVMSYTLEHEDPKFPFKVYGLINQDGKNNKELVWIEASSGTLIDADIDNPDFLRAFADSKEIFMGFVDESDDIYCYPKEELSILRSMLKKAIKLGWL